MLIYGEDSGLSDEVIRQIEDIKNSLQKYSGDEIALYYGYPIIEMDGSRNVMKACIVSLKGIIGLHESDEEAMVYNRHFTKLIMSSKSLSPLFFEGKKIYYSMRLTDLPRIKEQLASEPILSRSLYREINGIIQNFYGLNGKDERELKSENSLGAVIKKRNNEINMLDENQFNGIYKSFNSHMRIRGLAGSGKTILLVKKWLMSILNIQS